MLLRLLCSILGLFALAYADTLTLRSGNTVRGSFVGGDSREIRMAVGDRVEKYSIADVQSVEFGAGVVGRSTNVDPPAGENSLEHNNPSAGDIEIPTGTTIVVRMIDSVDSERDYLGQTFRASVDEPVLVNGQVVIDRGADALTKLVDSQKSGKLEGRTVMTLDLMSVELNGRTLTVATAGVSRASGSRGARTAKVVAGTAVVGAIIGAIAGGGKGAAIGAGAGGAVGAGAEVMTNGQRVRIPSETRLTFTLQQTAR